MGFNSGFKGLKHVWVSLFNILIRVIYLRISKVGGTIIFSRLVELSLNSGIYVISCVTAFIHLVVYLTTGPKPLPKRALHIVRSRASSFKLQYPLLSLRSSNSFLRLLPCLPVTSIPPCIFPSITLYRRQFLRKM